MQKVTFPYLVNIQSNFNRKQAKQVLKNTCIEIKVEVFGKLSMYRF